MSEPTIAEAKALAYRHRKSGVIILTFNGDPAGVIVDYSLASYGMTRELCSRMRDISDEIADRMEQGDLLEAAANRRVKDR